MTTTTNRNLALPAHNSDIDSWDAPVNSNSNILDASIGGVTSINVTSASGTVTLSNNTASPPSYICPIIELAGTLTADVNYQFPSGVGGNYTVFNAAGGAHTITFSSAGAGSSVVVPNGASALISVDGTNVLIGNTLASGASNTQVLYNHLGAVTGSANLTFDGTNLSCGGYLGAASLRMNGASSGYVGLQSPSVGGTTVYTLPAADGTSGQFLSTNGSATLAWSTLTSGVLSFSAGTTGLTPSTATTGNVTLAGTLAVANGGTGGTTQAAAQYGLGVPSTTGAGASGTWGISISGTATTATTANALNTGNSYTVAGLAVSGNSAFTGTAGFATQPTFGSNAMAFVKASTGQTGVAGGIGYGTGAVSGTLANGEIYFQYT